MIEKEDNISILEITNNYKNWELLTNNINLIKSDIYILKSSQESVFKNQENISKHLAEIQAEQKIQHDEMLTIQNFSKWFNKTVILMILAFSIGMIVTGKVGGQIGKLIISLIS